LRIDLDFESERREEVKQYLENKYGKNFVCSIGSFNTFKIKVSIKDLTRELGAKGANYEIINKITTSLFFREDKGGDFEELFIIAQDNKHLKTFIKDNPKLINCLRNILNTPKTSTVHPCATIILPDNKDNFNLLNSLPLKKQDDVLISEWEGEELNDLGYLKEDILGLSQLDKFKNILNLIKEYYNEEIDLYNIPLNDTEVFSLFQKGYNSDVFQFHSIGLTDYCQRLLPADIEDLIASVAIFRPGPIQSGAHYNLVDLKNGEKEIEYDFGLEEVTKNTYGLYIYQEQVMKACQVLGGFSLTETDEIRKALGKKKEKLILSYKSKFLEYAVNVKKCPFEEAEKIWHKLEVFSGYGFNRSHAAVYAITGYISQWLKHHYPIPFWVTAFEFIDKGSESGEKKEIKMIKYLKEIENLNQIYKNKISIVPPDINNSFEVTNGDPSGKIFYSLVKIKYISSIGAGKILEDRNKNGKYFSFKDFLSRMGEILDKREITNLILSGAFDLIEEVNLPVSIYERRKELIKIFYNYRKIDLKEFFNEEDQKEKWWWALKQKELIGIVDLNYKEISLDAGIFFGSEYSYYLDIQERFLKDNTPIYFGGILSSFEEKKTKNKKHYGLIKIENSFDFYDLYIWDEEYLTQIKEKLEKYLDKIIIFNASLKTGGMFDNVFYLSDKHQIYFIGTLEKKIYKNISVLKGDTVTIEEGNRKGKIIAYPSNASISLQMLDDNSIKIVNKLQIIDKDE